MTTLNGPSVRFDTSQIGRLRELLERFSTLKQIVGDFVRFRVVIDANFVIQELIQRVRFPERCTALEELIQATVIDAYAPRWLDEEMVSAVTKTASKRKMSREALWAQWQVYRRLLKWDDQLNEPGQHSTATIDPKDTPYIELEKKIGAHGILSKDAHIKKMGGHPLTLDFVFSTRRYARATIACVSIRVLGVVVSLLAFKALVETLRAATRGLTALPDGVKALLLLAGAAALLHPGARTRICEMAREMSALIVPVWNGVSEFVLAAATMATVAQSESTSSLAEASLAVRPPCAVNTGALARPRSRSRRKRSTPRRTQLDRGRVTRVSSP
jgi:predicted nucleic acid-binding protein